MANTRFDSFNTFIRRFRRYIIIAWIITAIISIALIPSFFSAVSYNITNTNFGGSQNSESQIAQNIVNTKFPSSNNSGGNTILLVVQPSFGNVYSGEIRDSISALNRTLSSDPGQDNFTGMTSVFSTEANLLNSTVSGFLSGVSSLASNITTINRSLYVLEQNLTTLNSEIYGLKNGINATSQLVYGIPATFVGYWESLVAGRNETPSQANFDANESLHGVFSSQGPQASSYYSLFYEFWNSSFVSQPSLTPLSREALAVNGTVAQFAGSPSINSTTRGLLESVAAGLNVTNWNQDTAITNLTISSIAAQLPSSLTTTLGVTARTLVQNLYDLGGNPTGSGLANLTISLITSGFPSGNNQSNSGISIRDLVNSSYYLGVAPNSTAIWELGAKFFSNATSASLSNSPLFIVNSTSLSSFLAGLGNTTSHSRIKSAIQNEVYGQSYSSYPLVLSNSLTRSFVSSDNRTMLVLFNYSFQPSSETISSFRAETGRSNISTLATTYVTGSSVLSGDLQNVFTPALGVTVVAGVIVSIVIVGLLFFAPLAAIIPLLIGGISIGISYAAIYLGIVLIGKGQLTFLTPTLTTLLMLGLAVDYSVLQLRRTREERRNGKTKEESVATSVRWAGEAVLTAGITVIVAYIVMAVANVPLFSDVGTAIAVGVSVLLFASLTLLPSLELALGDKLFWPGLRDRGKSGTKPSLLERISKKTIRYKIVVTVVVSLFAVSAVYATATTPTGVDFLKLIPNFQSNQGLTVITNNLGSSTIAPTEIVIVTATPIIRNNQFNQTLLNDIELISSTVSNSPGVVSVIGPTRPYGSTFNYSGIGSMTEPLYSQYLGGMMAQIGNDNKTALILVGLSSSSESQAAVNSILKLESNVKSLSLPKSLQVYYGGDTQGTYDSQSFLNGILPQVIIILAAAVYVILLLQLRSVFTPLRLVFTILCSVAFSLGLLSLTFYHFLSLPILDFAPLFVVVTMLGVGIDYDIFFVTRIREEVLNGKSDYDAIKTATVKVWVTIFGLGLVLSSVFGSLLLTGIGLLQEISFAVSAAVLIDVAAVILFFVPSLMAIAERFNWWPSKLGKNGRKKETISSSA